ncbi:MAG: TlpA disulfide reductase family protein [Planctomycetota bacterium]|nr:TlpA disulfide reductase family protein [Planctomycetota bacterium]
MTIRIGLLTAALLCLFCAPAHAQRGQSLKVGDAAPGLSIAEWVKHAKGHPEGDINFEKGTTYVVEFWATWCPPCRKSIPHLTDIQNKYDADELRIIGVTTEEPDVVKGFVKKQGRRMNYSVAIDKRNGTSRAWSRAAGQSGIPHAFIVDNEGKIQFIGHPLSEDFEDTLTEVMKGRYNRKLMLQAQSVIDAIEDARDLKNWSQYELMTQKLIERDPRIFYTYILDRFEVFLLKQEDAPKAYAYAEEVIETYPDDPELLGWLAEKIAAAPNIPDAKRDLDIALMAAKTARTNSDPDDPRFLAFEASVRFRRGEVTEAVDLQERAFFMASPRKKADYEPMLREYRSKSDELAAANGG